MKFVRLFGAQVATASRSPGYSLTEFATPKKGYQEASASVPAYLVFRPWFAARLQLAVPKARLWPKFASENGIVFIGPGPGDHEVWALGKQRFHINTKRGELDFASLKAVSKLLGVSPFQLTRAIRNGERVAASDAPSTDLASA